MTCRVPRLLASLATLLLAAHAHADEAGWMQIQVPGATAEGPATTVALYYPTMAAPRAVAMGPFALNVAIGGKPVDTVKALILLSHGTGGQASRVIDAMLADPAWKERIASDGHGPRVGALGHSAGGYTVLALAGARRICPG